MMVHREVEYQIGCSVRQQLLHVDIFEVQVPLQMQFADEWVGRRFRPLCPGQQPEAKWLMGDVDKFIFSIAS